MELPRNWRSSAPGILLASGLAACGGGGGGGGGDGGTGDPVEAVLNAMNVDTTKTPRVDDDQDPLPASYSPLGASAAINRFDEMLILGPQLAAGASNTVAVVEEVPLSSGFRTDVLHAPAASATPWMGSNYIRAGTRADVDGDGRDELLIVYQDHSSTVNPVQLVAIDDKQAGFAASSPKLVSSVQATSLEIAAGDFNGDGLPDLAVALVQSNSVRILFLNNANGVLSVSNQSILLPQTNSKAVELQAVLETGNLDYDNPQELAIVVNEYETALVPGGSNVTSGTSRYYIHDDGVAGFKQLDANVVAAVVNNASVGVKVGDVAIGDVDGDGVEEVVLGGMTSMGPTSQVGDIKYLVYVLDDAKRNFAPLAATVVPHKYVGGDAESGTARHLNFLHINVVDVDGNGAKEIQANEYVFQNLRSARSLQQIHEIPADQLLFARTSGIFRFNCRTSSVVASNVMSLDGGREQIVFYSESFNTRRVQIWGLDPTNTWSMMHDIAMQFGSEARPQIIPANVDTDTLGLKYSEGSYRLVFTEPVLIAALAAAPCGTNIGQNLDSCRTAFGKGTSSTTEDENAWNVTAAVSSGFEFEYEVLGVKVGGLEVIFETEASMRRFTRRSYTLSRRVVYTTGPIEDAVIFVSVPLDIYTYKILSHPNPELIGGEIQVRLPRKPVTQMVSREVYNDHVVGGSVKIDNAIFKHTKGAPLSYRSAAEKNGLLGRFKGIETEEVTVGEGTGNVNVELNVFKEESQGKSYSFQSTLDIKGTLGSRIMSAKIGAGVDSMLAFGRGQESIYQGGVSQIASAFFPAQSYNFGLFSYVYEVPGSDQKFEVLDYWVRKP